MYSERTIIVDVVVNDALINPEISPLDPGNPGNLGGLSAGDVAVPMAESTNPGGGGFDPGLGDQTESEFPYTMSMTAADLFDAARSGCVVRRHDVRENEHEESYRFVRLSSVYYSPLTGYAFNFESGDSFYAATDDDYPGAMEISDAASSGGGGGALIVNATEEYGTATVALDRTWTEIHDAQIAFVSVEADEGVRAFFPVFKIGTVPDFETGEIAWYFIDIVMYGEDIDDTTMVRFSTDTEDGVLTHVWE